MDSNFIFPDLKKVAQPYSEDLWETTNEYGWVDVMYGGQAVMQIWNLPMEDKKKNIVLNFWPYSFDYGLVKRFKECPYYKDFAALDSEEDNYMQAAYGTDIVHALKVASYILTEVYNIPTSYPLDVQAEKPLATW